MGRRIEPVVGAGERRRRRDDLCLVTPWAVAAAVAFVIAVVIGMRRLSLPAGRALSAALTINILLRWDPSWRFGMSALVTGLVAALIVVTGLSRRGRFARQTVRRAATVLAIIAGIAILGAGVATAQAYGDLRNGERALRRAASALQQGDIPLAVEQLDRSNQLLERAADALDRPWARPALALPVIGQHLDAIVDIGHGAVDLTDEATASVAQVDVESLRFVNGVIDLDAIELLEQPVSRINAALRQMSAALTSGRSPWLVAPIGNRVDHLGAEIDELVEQTDRALTAVQLAPSMLGGDGPRTYFVAFTTPAEARGLGGFMGTWAELHADDGRLEVIRTGRTSELSTAQGEARTVLNGPADYIARYGKFGAGVDGAPVAVDFWSNVTMSPDFPSVTEVFAQLYPASGGTEIDGAIALDVETIARFLELTGPIAVEGPEGMIRLSSGDAVQYLFRDQYADIADEETATTYSKRSRRNWSMTSSAGTYQVLAHLPRPLGRRWPRAAWSSGPVIRKISRSYNASGSPAISRPRTGTASRSSARTAAPTSWTPTSDAASAMTPGSTRAPVRSNRR